MAKTRLIAGPVQPHKMAQRRASDWQCEACGSSAKSWKQAARMMWLPCKGTVLKRAALRARPAEDTEAHGDPFLGYALYRHGTLHFCGRCGYNSDKRTIGLERRCSGKPAKNYGPRLVAMLAGRQPRAGTPFPMQRERVTAAQAALWMAAG